MDCQLVERIQAMLRELAAIRAELSGPATDPATGMAVSKIPAEYVRGFKLEIDQMRLFLWAYMDTWAVGSTDPRNRLEQIRMESAAEMLRQLQQDFRITGVPPTTEGRRLSVQVRGALRSCPSESRSVPYNSWHATQPCKIIASCWFSATETETNSSSCRAASSRCPQLAEHVPARGIGQAEPGRRQGAPHVAVHVRQ